jgi:peptidoglycan/LPS O-acetylase OafA/YrhL
MTRAGYRPALDGIRAIAILAVIGAHVYDWPRLGGNGVELFFVLSGFLITTLLLEEHRVEGHVSLKQFYRRRAYRLLPALYTMLAVFLVLEIVEGALDRDATVGIVAGLLYVTNFLREEFANIPFEMMPLWTLAQEEQFYFLWPPLLFLVLRARILPALEIAVIGAIAAATVGWVTLGQNTWFGSGPITQMYGILVGCAAAVCVVKSPRTLSAARWLGLPGLVIAVGMLFWMPSGLSFYHGPFIVMCLAAGFGVLSAYEGRPAIVRHVLGSRPLVFVGRISYSLYLWNVLVYFQLARINSLDEDLLKPLAIGLTFLVATCSYYFIELPFLRRKRRLTIEVRAPELGVTPSPL